MAKEVSGQLSQVARAMGSNEEDRALFISTFYKGAIATIEPAVETLVDSSIKLSPEERKQKEEEAKRHLAVLFDAVPGGTKRILPHSEYTQSIGEIRLDDHARRGIIYVPSGKFGYKIVEPMSGMPAQVVHRNNVNDSALFAEDKRFNMVQIVDPFTITGPSLDLTDRVSGSTTRKPHLAQIQLYIPGHTLSEVIAAIRTAEGRKRVELEQRLEKLVQQRGVADIFHWYKKAPKRIDGEGTEMTVDQNATNQQMIAYVIATIENMAKHTNCGLARRPTSERGALELVIDSEKVLLADLGREQFGYGPALDCSPDNIVVRHPLGTLTRDNIGDLAEHLMDDNLMHVDPPVRMGNITEDIAMLLESYPLRRMTDGTIFGAQNTKACHEYLGTEFGYKVSLERHHLIAFYQAMKRAEVLIGYAEHVSKTQDTRGSIDKQLESYRKEVWTNLMRARKHLRHVIEIKQDQKGEDPALQVYKGLKTVMNQVLDFNKLTF